MRLPLTFECVASQTGDVELNSFSQIEAVQSYFWPSEMLPGEPAIEGRSEHDVQPLSEPISKSEKERPLTSVPTASTPRSNEAFGSEEQVATPGKIPVPSFDQPPQLSSPRAALDGRVRERERNSEPTKSTSSLRARTDKAASPPPTQSGGMRRTLSFTRRGGGAAPPTAQSTASGGPRSTKRADAPERRPASASAARPASNGRSGKRGEPAGPGAADSAEAARAAARPQAQPGTGSGRPVERKSSFPRLGIPKLSFGRRPR